MLRHLVLAVCTVFFAGLFVLGVRTLFIAVLFVLGVCVLLTAETSFVGCPSSLNCSGRQLCVVL